MNQHNFQVNFENDHIHILNCQYGVVSVNPNHTKFGFIPKEKRLQELTYNIDESCTNYTGFIEALQPCYLQGYCEIKFNLNWINDNDDCFQKISNMKGVLSLYCKNVVFSINGNKEESIIKIYLYNFGFGGSVPFFYIYFVIALAINYSSFMKFYSKSYYHPNEFCLLVRNLPTGLDQSSAVRLTYQ